jgi:hypothetical protein
LLLGFHDCDLSMDTHEEGIGSIGHKKSGT